MTTSMEIPQEFIDETSEAVLRDKEIVSEITGKLIPLDEDSDEPHQCEEWKSLHRRYYDCRGCGAPIYFDKHMSKNGKYIPLDKSTGGPHNCDFGK